MDARADAAGRAAMDQTAQLLAQYGFDPNRWAGVDDALYSRLDIQVRQTAAPLVGLIRNG